MGVERGSAAAATAAVHVEQLKVVSAPGAPLGDVEGAISHGLQGRPLAVIAHVRVGRRCRSENQLAILQEEPIARVPGVRRRAGR